MEMDSDLSELGTGVVLDRHMTISAAVTYSGYNPQYLRRMLRAGVLRGVKVGQVWLVQIASLDAYLQEAKNTDDRRYGPRVYQSYTRKK